MRNRRRAQGHNGPEPVVVIVAAEVAFSVHGATRGRSCSKLVVGREVSDGGEFVGAPLRAMWGLGGGGIRHMTLFGCGTGGELGQLL